MISNKGSDNSPCLFQEEESSLLFSVHPSSTIMNNSMPLVRNPLNRVDVSEFPRTSTPSRRQLSSLSGLDAESVQKRTRSSRQVKSGHQAKPITSTSRFLPAKTSNRTAQQAAGATHSTRLTN